MQKPAKLFNKPEGRLWPALILLLLVTSASFSQQFNFDNYGVEDGLPQSTVYDILQDSDGYLWMGTDGGGLCRYDGFSFKRYGKTEGLNANVVRRVVEDKNRVIWLATNGGLYYISGGKISSFTGIKDNRSIYFFSILEDSHGNLWATTMGKGVYLIRGRPGAFTVKHFTTSSGLTGDYIFDVCEDASGKVWLASFGNGIDIYEPSSGKFSNLTFADPALGQVLCIKSVSDNRMALGTKTGGAFIVSASETSDVRPVAGTGNEMVWSIAVDASKTLYFATEHSGVVSENGLKLNRSNGLINNQVLKVLFDRENNLWIGTNGSGLSKFKGNRFLHVTDRELPGLTQVTALLGDTGNVYWAGTANSGLYRFIYDGATISGFKQFTASNGLSSNNVTGICRSVNGSLWVSTRNGISHFDGRKFIHYNKREGLIDSSANCIFADSRDRIWVGTSGGLTFRDEKNEFINISESNGLINNEVQCFAEDGDKNIWIGTFGGLVKFDGKNLHSFFEEDGLTEKKVLSLALNRRGDLYIGTFGGGIFEARKNGDKYIFRQLPLKLSSDNIFSLVFENDSILLAGTNQGLHKIIFTPGFGISAVSHMGRAAGFTFVENSQGAAMNDPAHNGTFFGTAHGITIYFPGNDHLNEVAPALRVTGSRINGKERAIERNVVLNYNDNWLSVDFVAISLVNPSANEYYARLQGLDSAWNRLIPDKMNPNAFLTLEYKKLQPGNYRLEIKAANNDGKATVIEALAFTIEKPFYRTAWFILLVAAFVIGLIVLFFKLREKQLLQEKIKLEKIVERRTAEVVESRKKIEAQKDLLQMQKMEITDSINYSKRIQNAILPEKETLTNKFPQSFVLYMPKDIVSGDFYFFSEAGNRFFLAVADCTGHGVPGAFMSMIGSRELAEVVKQNAPPGKTLNRLNVAVRKTLKQNNQKLGIRDGMDIGLLMYEEWLHQPPKIHFSGANRPLWLHRKGTKEIVELKPTKTAIGGFTQDDQLFDQHETEICPGDSVYLFSDGFADQFGGEAGKKMMTRRFKELILECSEMPMTQQEKVLADFFHAWKGSDNEQVDDVLVIGVRF